MTTKVHETIIHGGVGNKCCGGYNRRQWFRCGACRRKVCWCFGGDSALKSFVDLCCDCWSHAMEQAKLEGYDPEDDAVLANLNEHQKTELRASRSALARMILKVNDLEMQNANLRETLNQRQVRALFADEKGGA